jgi:hypothetical protein
VNPSNAPHVLTSREEKKVERSIAKEATVAEKQVAQVGKTLKSAEKDEGKAEKVGLQTQCLEHPYKYIDTVDQATQKAQRAREKAVKQEHRSAQALTDAQHKHDLAVADEKKAANDLSVCNSRTTCRPSRTHQSPPINRILASSRCRWLLQMCQRLLQEAHQTVEGRRTELEQVQRKKDSGDVGLLLSSSTPGMLTRTRWLARNACAKLSVVRPAGPLRLNPTTCSL